MDQQPTSEQVRAWARAQGIEVGARGPVKPELLRQYLNAQATP